MHSDLLKLALLVSISGLVLLASLACFIEPPHTDLNSLDSFNGRTVLVQGVIMSASHRPDITFLELGKERVKVVLFGLPSHKFAKGDVIEIVGDITRYKGELEIIAEEIRCLRC